jgi:hypothetical protein
MQAELNQTLHILKGLDASGENVKFGSSRKRL